MRRREFIAGLGGAVVAWSVPVYAQPSGRVRRIAVLMALSKSDAEGQSWIAAFTAGLKELGWTQGANALLDVRWANGDVALMGSLAKELVGQRPDVILASSSPVLAALKRETSVIPIIFVNVSNPVGAGFVKSLPQPGGNATGLANYEGEISSKWLEQLNEVAPAVSRVGVLLHADAAAHQLYWQDIAAAAPGRGITPVPTPFRDAADIERGLATIAGEPNAG